MTDILVPVRLPSVGLQTREQRWRHNVLALTVLWSTLLAGVVAHLTAPRPFSLALVLLVISCGAAIARPVVGVHLTIFLSLIGDMSTSPWWPFTKNLSSRESILYLSDALSLTPLELMLSVTWASFLLRAIVDPNWRFRLGALGRPMLVVGGFVTFAFVYGQMTGGVRMVAIFEARPLLYLVLLYLLIVNTFTEKRHYRRALGLAMIAISVQSLLSLNYYRHLSPFERENLESLSEHTATVHMNSLFVFTMALFLFRGSRWKRWGMALLSVPVVWAYLLSQRRGAMVAFFVGAIVLFIVLYRRRRTTFWKVTPPLSVLSLVYLAGTWNSTGAAGLPATAVKSALFPGSLSAEDAASSAYRDLETYNLWSTIRASPLTGRGFGRPFDVVVSLPDITFFEFWQYLPHNSILWLWIKLGFFGFIAMLYLLARALYAGGRTAIRAGSADDLAVTLAGLGYVVMFAVFAYVDIGFGIRPIIYLALAIAICTDFDAIRSPAPSPVLSEAVIPDEIALAGAAPLTSLLQGNLAEQGDQSGGVGAASK